MNGIIEYLPEELYIKVKAATPIKTIEEELRQHGRISELIKNWEIYRELQKTYLPFAYYALPNIFYPAEYIRIGENDKALKLMREFERTYVSPADAYINLGYLLLYVEMERMCCRRAFNCIGVKT